MWKNSKKTFTAGFALAVAAVLCLGAPPGVIRTNVTLAWDPYPTNQISPDLVLKVYSSTNATAPLSTWPLLTTVNPTNSTVTLPTDAQQRFFVMTASNWWGESFFSNVTNTPPTLRLTNNLRLGL